MDTQTINGKTTVIAVFGDPVSHSLSPAMHNAAFAALDWNCVYIPCHVKPEQITHAVQAIKSLNFKGVNITIPHKQSVLPFLDEVSEDSKMSGSINTIIHRDNRLIGTSTDGTGFLRSLKEDGNFDITDKNILIFGAGGSARALVYSLIGAGIKSLTIINRNFAKAVDLEERIWNDTGFTATVHELNRLNELDWNSYDLLINTTSIGLHDEQSIMPEHFLAPKHFVYDIVYRKGGTKLYNDAIKTGCQVLSGLSLLLYQGVESFKLWFDTEPPIEVMRNKLNEITK